MAQYYQVSYPTIRAKLDRVIERLQAAAEGRPRDPMADLLAGFVERGELAPPAARKIMDLHRSLHNKGKGESDG